MNNLEGFPKIVTGSVDISFNKLKSLEFCPTQVHGNFTSMHNLNVDLVGSPKIVNGTYTVSSSKLKSLEGSPDKVKDYILEDLKGTKLVNLEGITQKINNLSIDCISLKSLKGIPSQIDGDFTLLNNSVKYSEFVKYHPKTIKGDFKLLRGQHPANEDAIRNIIDVKGDIIFL